MTGFQHLRTAVSRSGGAAGAIILVFVLFVAFLGPFLAPYSPADTLFLPGAPPGNGFWLGTDFLGRDVLSRLMNGGTSVLLMATAATVSAYAIGVATGVLTGYVGGFTDMIMMRIVDIALAFPPLMVLLLLVGGLENHVWVLILGVVIVQIPGIARVTRSVAQSVSHSDYVDVARIRGDSLATILRRDVLANISSTVLADFGVRFGVSIIMIASMNYLGLGLVPPTADWGLMISENQDYMALNAYAVVGPAVMLALITVGVNLLADAYVQAVHSGSSSFRAITELAGEAPQAEAPQSAVILPGAGRGGA